MKGAGRSAGGYVPVETRVRVRCALVLLSFGVSGCKLSWKVSGCAFTKSLVCTVVPASNYSKQGEKL